MPSIACSRLKGEGGLPFSAHDPATEGRSHTAVQEGRRGAVGAKVRASRMNIESPAKKLSLAGRRSSRLLISMRIAPSSRHRLAASWSLTVGFVRP